MHGGADEHPVFLHVDIDAFYASVEQRDHPELRGRPVIVGARPGHRGVVSACSYEARVFGVRSAMPMSQAVRLCPGGVFLPVRMQRYVEVSRRVMAILRECAPVFRQLSIDEASLELSGTRRLLGEPEAVAKQLKRRVLGEAGLTISVGVAANPYLAKLACEKGKPDGLLSVPQGQEAGFLEALELKDLWGVGARTLERLRQAGIGTVRELREAPRGTLQAQVGSAAAAYLALASRGEDPGFHPAHPASRSISSEVTFETDTAELSTLSLVLLDLAHELAERLIAERLASSTVVLKLRLHDFRTTTAQRSLPQAVTAAPQIAEVARELLALRWDGRTPVRLIGLCLSGVTEPEAVQGELFESPYERQARVERAVAELHQRLGNVKLTKASLLARRRGPR